MALASRHVRLGAVPTIDIELDSYHVQVAMSLQGHTLKSGSKYCVGWVGPEPDTDWVSELDSR